MIFTRALPSALNNRRSNFKLERRPRCFSNRSSVKFIQFDAGLLDSTSLHWLETTDVTKKRVVCMPKNNNVA